MKGTRSPAAGAALPAPGSRVERLATPRPTEVAPGLEGRLVRGLSRPGQRALRACRERRGAVAEASARCSGPAASPQSVPREGATQPPPRARPVQPPGVPPEGAELGLRALPAPCPGSPWASKQRTAMPVGPGRWALKLPRAAHRAQHLPGAPTRCPARPSEHTALTFGRAPGALAATPRATRDCCLPRGCRRGPGLWGAQAPARHARPVPGSPARPREHSAYLPPGQRWPGARGPPPWVPRAPRQRPREGPRVPEALQAGEHSGTATSRGSRPAPSVTWPRANGTRSRAPRPVSGARQQRRPPPRRPRLPRVHGELSWTHRRPASRPRPAAVLRFTCARNEPGTPLKKKEECPPQNVHRCCE